jgi:hypothetical protein
MFYFFVPPLDVPELFPKVEKMIDSFRIIPIQAPSSSLNTTETADLLQQLYNPSPTLELSQF